MEQVGASRNNKEQLGAGTGIGTRKTRQGQ
jgi:hypothetical protein